MLKIRIETKNEAFDYNLEDELKRCLEDVINKIQIGHEEATIHDTNGNKVGNFKLTNR